MSCGMTWSWEVQRYRFVVREIITLFPRPYESTIARCNRSSRASSQSVITLSVSRTRSLPQNFHRETIQGAAATVVSDARIRHQKIAEPQDLQPSSETFPPYHLAFSVYWSSSLGEELSAQQPRESNICPNGSAPSGVLARTKNELGRV
jgi:hypothetical protein